MTDSGSPVSYPDNKHGLFHSFLDNQCFEKYQRGPFCVADLRLTSVCNVYSYQGGRIARRSQHSPFIFPQPLYINVFGKYS